MAAIEQIIQIAANERAAESAQTTADAAIPHTAITNLSGSGLTITNPGTPQATYSFAAPTVVNLSDVQTYDNPAARNMADNITWHRGDIAIVTNTGDTSEGGTTPTASNYAVLSVPTATTFIIPGAYDRVNDEYRSDIPDIGDVVRFHEGGNTFSGSTSGGTDFIINDRARTNVGNDQVTFTVNRSLSAVVPPVNGAETVYIGEGPTVTTVTSGTYIFTADADQTAPAATVNADWTLLNVPGGTAGSSDLATFTLDTSASVRLESITYNSSTDVLTVNGNTIELATTTPALPTITRNFYQYIGTTINIEGIGPGGTDGNQTITIPVNATNWANRFGGAGIPSVWPATASLYMDGQKLIYGTVAQSGEWVFDSTRANMVITITQAQRREYPAGQMIPVDLEVETMVLSQ